MRWTAGSLGQDQGLKDPHPPANDTIFIMMTMVVIMARWEKCSMGNLNATDSETFFSANFLYRLQYH